MDGDQVDDKPAAPGKSKAAKARRLTTAKGVASNGKTPSNGKTATNGTQEGLGNRQLLAALRALQRGEFDDSSARRLRRASTDRSRETFNELAQFAGSLRSEIVDLRQSVGREGRTHRRLGADRRPGRLGRLRRRRQRAARRRHRAHRGRRPRR